jgi:hypothetical protein
MLLTSTKRNSRIGKKKKNSVPKVPQKTYGSINYDQLFLPPWPVVRPSFWITTEKVDLNKKNRKLWNSEKPHCIFRYGVYVPKSRHLLMECGMLQEKKCTPGTWRARGKNFEGYHAAAGISDLNQRFLPLSPHHPVLQADDLLQNAGYRWSSATRPLSRADSY